MLKESGQRKHIGSTLDKDIFEDLKNYSEETSIPISKILDKAVKQYLESIKEKKPVWF